MGTLAIGGSYTVTQNVTLPYCISGNLTSVSSPTTPGSPATPGPGYVNEFQDEGNNHHRGRVAGTADEPARPPGHGRQRAPSRRPRDQSLSVTYTVTNASTAPTPPGQTTWTDAIYLSVDQFFDLNSDILLGYETHTGGLAAAPATGERHLQRCREAGRALLCLRRHRPDPQPAVRTAGQVDETNDTNNATASTLPVIINQPPPADLVVTSITVPADRPVGPAGHSSVDGQLTRASSPPAAPGPTAVYLATTPVWNVNDPLIGEASHAAGAAGLATGQSTPRRSTPMLPPAIPGSYPSSSAPTSLATSTRGPDPPTTPRLRRPDAGDRPRSCTSGCRWQTTLTKGEDRSTRSRSGGRDAPGLADVGGPERGQRDLPALQRRARRRSSTTPSTAALCRPNQSAVIPGTQAGPTTPGQRGPPTPVTLLAQLLPFEITNVHARRGGRQRVRHDRRSSGAQFDPQAIVKLVRPGFAEYEPVSYQVVNSTEIVAIFDLTDAPHGLYDVW